MIFGKTNDEKAEAEFAKLEKKATKILEEQARIEKNYNKWFKTFVVIPVKLESGEWVWLQKVWYHLDIRKIHIQREYPRRYEYKVNSNKKFYHLARHDLVPLIYVH